MMRRLLIVGMMGWATVFAEEGPSFNEQVRPLLSKKCFMCHGPDAGEDGKMRKGNLRLDQADGPQGAYRVEDGLAAIKPGDLAGSEVWKRITSDDPDDVMPPPEKKSHVAPLTGEEKALLKRWIESGAEYEDFWAFVPVEEVEVPEPKDGKWSGEAIDRFVMKKLEAAGVKPSPKADKRTLIRRLTFDLTGLPPTLEEIEKFVSDDSEDAYEILVSELMDRPQYGEHMAKYWLDLVRFADTNGIHHDHYRDMTSYRDWVIRSFNENLGYDQFVKWQVAGDLYENPTTDQLIGSGFNRLHLIIDVGTALPEESFVKNVVDRTSAVGTAFMGMTLGCAVCHDHKYDPISQREFFQMYAFFNNFDGKPETGGRSGPDFRRGLQKPYIDLPSEEQQVRLDEFASSLARMEGELKGLQGADPKDEGAIKKKDGEIRKMRGERDKFLESVRAAMVMKERAEVRPTHVLVRGAYDNPGDLVTRGTPEAWPELKPRGEVPDRMDFANWLVREDHPLTARVAVNRFWQQFFGVGLVKTSEDFGAQGEWPSHPDLLEYLSHEFMASKWDVKALVRSIVLSETYQQSSVASPHRFEEDPENRMLARGSRYRMDSEMIRDQILALSGKLNLEMYGVSVKPPQPPGLWKLVGMPSSYPREFKADEGDRIYRRSLYSFWKRGLPPPQMTIFDAPTREACIARRERTNTPLQALVLMNEEQYFLAAERFAGRMLAMEGLNDAERMSKAYEAVTAREPSEAALGVMKESWEEFRAHYRENPELAKELVKEDGDAEVLATRAAWTMLAHSLLNLDVTKTRE